MTDMEYKQELLRGVGENPADWARLGPIMGRKELLAVLRGYQNTPDVYRPGDDFANVKNKTFGANLHIHTTNSDGLMTVAQLLDLGARYGDSLAEYNPGRKFYIAITDHNTTNGAIEALNLVVDNPEKYKNLKIALGIEASAIFSSSVAGAASEVHLLSYCLNPAVDAIAGMNRARLGELQNNVSVALSNANVRYHDVVSH